MKNFLKTVTGCIIAIGLILSIASCEKAGCTNPAAANYNSSAKKDDGSCKIMGCTDPTASNYNSSANTNDGSCYYPNPNGQVVFYYNSVGTTATVNIDGQQGFITVYYSSGTPSCGASGCANFTLPAGPYTYSASSVAGTNWSGILYVGHGTCTVQLLQ